MRYLLTSLLMFFIISAYTETVKADTYITIGTGTASCGKFTQWKQNNNPQQMDLVVQWVWGFLSAYNSYGYFGNKFHAVTHLADMPDSPTVLLYVESYCKKAPLDSVNEAAWSLIRDLHGTVVWNDSQK